MRLIGFIVSVAVLACLPVHTLAQEEDVLRPRGRSIESQPVWYVPYDESSTTMITIGVEAGGNLSFLNRGISGQLTKSLLEIYHSGSGIAPFVNLIVDVPVSPTIAFNVRFGYDSRSFSNNVQASIDCQDVATGSLMSVITTDVELTHRHYNISIAPGIRAEVTNNVSVLVSVVGLFGRGDAEDKWKQTILNPDQTECRFNYGMPNESTVLEFESSQPYKKSRYGLDLGLLYRVPITSSVSLVPRAGFQYFFTPFDDAGELDDLSRPISIGVQRAAFTEAVLNGLQVGIGLWINL